MATKLEYSQLSLYVYNTADEQNRPLLPTGWTEVAYYPDDLVGFSYGIFRNTATNEVVVAYTGTNEKKVVDFCSQPARKHRPWEPPGRRSHMWRPRDDQDLRDRECLVHRPQPGGR